MGFFETVVVITGAIGGLITTICWSIRRSRCEIVETPCLTCRRKLMSSIEMREDALHNETKRPVHTGAVSIEPISHYIEPIEHTDVCI